ncbi:hypothetical protein H4R34_002974 [Dimargaris verticillata]|uniref:WD40-repeat-containing domain protein n=1 Tax=Dimargaris verticillata TaxID=2761393 RepID=A0A9W8B329_9FUNG|nr:hypothetical protein H4R34_002974 [Dimargaris verticillata]
MEPLGPNIGTHSSQFLMADADRATMVRRDQKYAQFKAHQQQQQALLTSGQITELDAHDVRSKVLDLLVLDTSTVLLGQASHVAKCIDLKTGQVRRVFRGHTGPITSVAVYEVIGKPDTDMTHGADSCAPSQGAVESAPLSWVVTGSWDKSIRVWDQRSGECLYVLAGHSDFVKSLALAPGGRHCRVAATNNGQTPSGHPWLFSGSSDATIRQWDLATRKCVRVLQGHSRAVDALAYEPHFNTLFSASSDTSIRQWNVHTGEQLREFKGHLTSVFSIYLFSETPCYDNRVAYSHVADQGSGLAEDDYYELWSVSADKTALQWSMAKAQPVTTLTHSDFVKAVLVTQAHVVTGSCDEQIRVWDKASGKCLKTLVGHFDEVGCLGHAGGDTLVSASLDGTVRKWSLKQILSAPGTTFNPDASVSKAHTPKPLTPGRRNTTTKPNPRMTLTEEEDRELAELLSDDE